MSWTTGLDVQRKRIGPLPLWLEDAKGHLQIDTDDHNDLINIFLTGAIETVEKYCGICLVETEVTTSWDELHTTEELPYGPVRSVTEAEGCSIKGQMPGWAKAVGSGQAAQIKYIAGYEEIPEPIKIAVLKLVTDNFEQRAGFTMSGRLTMMEFPNDWRATAKPYRRRTFLT